jgi:putative hemolysin
LIALFPSGAVAASDSDVRTRDRGEWNVFTAKMIRKSGATIVPFYFTGSNSRWYQIANQISPVLRQGLLIHEVVHAFDKPQAPVIGSPSARMNGKTASPNRASSWHGCGSGRCR